MEHQQLADALDRRMSQHRQDLDALVRIPSVSADGFDAMQVRRSAEAVRELLTARGFEHARLLEIDGAHPAVYADHLHADGAPTVLLYAHHDVQPPGDAALWSSPAFEPVERDGRLYGRGSADDKAGVLVHVAAVDAWLQTAGSLPVNVKVFIEGEEEIGSEHLDAFLDAYGDVLRADVVIVTDTDNWQIGVPGLTYLLRGLVECDVEIRGLDHALHSGMYGGPVAEPLTALLKLLAGLTDDSGSIAIPAFTDDVRRPTTQERARLSAVDFDIDRFRAEAGVADTASLAGDPDAHPLELLWMRPAVTVIGIDAPSVATASNTIVPTARARVTVRLAPGQDPQRASRLLAEHLSSNVPWGLPAQVTPGAAAPPFLVDPEGPAFEAAARALEAAYGTPVVYQGLGGTIPFLEPITTMFADDPAQPIPALLLGVEDPDTRAHGIDESLHLGDWQRTCLAEAYLFAELAAVGKALR